MAQKINQKCLECSKVSFKKIVGSDRVEKPKCWRRKRCSKKRSWYRKMDHYRAQSRKRHRYIKLITEHCAICHDTINLNVHHIITQLLGGLDTENNTITLCHSCHVTITVYNRIIAQKGYSVAETESRKERENTSTITMQEQQA
jgi:hypothetical protein